MVSLVRGGRGEEKEVTFRSAWFNKLPLGGKFPNTNDETFIVIGKIAGGGFEKILRDTVVFKRERARRDRIPLAGQTWALIFSKSSTRTRVSFETGIRELGGQVMFLNSNDIQLGRGEPIKDTARVLGRMIHGAVIRTFAQSDVEEFAEFSKIPTINALTDDEHPCQILADIFTFREKRGPISGKVVTFVGDGACNVPISWIWAATKLDLNCASPRRKNSSRPRKFWNARVAKSFARTI
ncbi:MAG: hypothetical protein WDM76_19570 [Limisphaerales bacterium]